MYGQSAASTQNQEGELQKVTEKVILPSVIQPVVHESLLCHKSLQNGPQNNYKNAPGTHSHTQQDCVRVCGQA